MLNTAIVGLGWWGQELVNAVQADGVLKGNKIRFSTGVVRTLAKSIDYAATQGLVLTDDYAAMLADPEIDAVALATPHGLHEAQVTQAAQAGKHVFVEKPLAMTTVGAKGVRQACEKAGIVLALGHNRRFLPAVLALKSMVDDGTLGTILHVEGNFSNRYGFDYPKQDWRANRTESPAGGMTAGGIHMLDTLMYLCGHLSRVQAVSLRQVLKVPMDDTTSMLLRFTSGISGYLGTMTTTARNWSLYVLGTKGWAHMRDHELLDVCFVGEDVDARSFEPIDMERAELEAFADAVAGNSVYPVPLNDVVHGITVLEAITESAGRDGEPVAISD